MNPLKDNGAEGVAAIIQDYTAQLAGAMARTATSNITNIDKELIWRR